MSEPWFQDTRPRSSVLVVEAGTGPRRIRRGLGSIAELSELRIEAAGSPDLARAMLRLRTFDAVVIDAQTPRLAEALSSLRSEPRASGLPFIVAGDGPALPAMRGVAISTDAELARRLKETLGMQGPKAEQGEPPSELAAMLSATGVGLIGADASGTCVFANAAAALVLGCQDSGDLIGRRIAELIPEQVLRAGRGDVLRFDGHLSHVAVSVAEPGPGSGRVAEVYTVTDRKHEREREARLFSAQKTMAMGELTSGICHDFANLLTIVCGNLAEITKCRDLAPDVKDMAQDALSAAVDGMNLTRRLVAVARERQTRVRAVDIGLTLGEFGRLLQRLVRRPVELEVATEDGVHAMLDRTQLESAVMNLVLNAQHAMPSGGKIRLSVDMAVDTRSGIPEPMARIVVLDEGAGMGEEQVRRATEPFFTTRADSGGTGLGLAMVADFAKNFAGHLDIRSALGKGTRVTLMFPWVAEASPRTQVFALETEEKLAATRRALVVDPEPRIRRYASRLLAGTGHQVVEAADAAAAAQLLAEQPEIALVLVDQHVAVQRVGRSSATDLAHWITTYRPRVELVITTSDEAPPDSELAGLRFLRKPYSEAELARTLRSFALHAGR